ncbi:MAG: EAL domain-containing protein [Eubacterium sp.]|nr:EAL domain-containing protein [Eubacterium sp.]
MAENSAEGMTETEQNRIKEELREIVLSHFYSYYARQNIEETLKHVSQNVNWIGSKEYFVAYDKDEYERILRKELVTIPENCSLKTKTIEAIVMNPKYNEVHGELELKLPYKNQIAYSTLRFSMIILLEDSEYRIVSIHTSGCSESWIAGGKTKEAPDQLSSKEQDMLSRRDSLTGLYLLEYFKEKVEHFLEKSDKDENYVMLCTDVTHFERINNLYGLKQADKMLIDLAGLLMKSGEGVICACRSIADHILVLMTYQDRQALRKKLQELCDSFGRTIKNRYPEASPRLGIGVYEIRDKKEEIENIVEHANVARKGLRLGSSSSIVFYDDHLTRGIDRVREIESRMENALANGEFKVYFQPKYNLDTGSIAGAEALCRWIPDDGKAIYPDEFIPVFEENGFIMKLDYYMLNKVCEMIQKRQREGKENVRVSVNQSRVLLNDEQYQDKVAAVLARHGSPGQFIELELTERIFQDDLTEFANIMDQIRGLGIKWSIDDFGTGYSSLNLLKELPVDIIKIDKSFLDEAETSETSKIIIRKTVELTQELDKHVLCEGVETESQAEYLREISCDMAQGYLYARPMPMDQFEDMLDKEMRV